MDPVAAHVSPQSPEPRLARLGGRPSPAQACCSWAWGGGALIRRHTHGIFPQLFIDCRKQNKPTNPSLYHFLRAERRLLSQKGLTQLIYLPGLPDLFAVVKYESYSQRKIFKIGVFKYAPGDDYDGKSFICRTPKSLLPFLKNIFITSA